MLEKFIGDEFTKTVFKAIDKYAKKYGKPDKDVAVFFNLNEEGECDYKIYITENGSLTFKENVTFKDLLDVKIDVLQKGKKVPPLISLSLLALNDDLAMEPFTAKMMMNKYSSDGEPGKKTLRMCLYGNQGYIKDVTITEIIEIISKLAIDE